VGWGRERGNQRPLRPRGGVRAQAFSTACCRIGTCGMGEGARQPKAFTAAGRRGSGAVQAQTPPVSCQRGRRSRRQSSIDRNENHLCAVNQSAHDPETRAEWLSESGIQPAVVLPIDRQRLPVELPFCRQSVELPLIRPREGAWKRLAPAGRGMILKYWKAS